MYNEHINHGDADMNIEIMKNSQGHLVAIVPKRASDIEIHALRKAMRPIEQFRTVDGRQAFILANSVMGGAFEK